MKWFATCGSLLLLFWHGGARAQSTVPKAYYPLTTDQYRSYIVVQPWDVSGNAQHGNTYNSVGDTLYDRQLSRLKCPDTTTGTSGVYVVQKAQTNKACVNIPDPTISNAQPYTVSFWLYLRADMMQLKQTVIRLPGLQLQTDYYSMVLGINSGTTVTRKKSPQIFINGVTDNDQWLFIAVRHDASGKDTVRYCRAPFTGMANMAISTATTSETGYPTSGAAQLMDSSFKGALGNVRFYNAALSNAEIDSVKQQELNQFNGGFMANSYLNKNVYAYYPLNGSNAGKNVSRFTGRDAISMSGVARAPDRYGRTDSAASFPMTNAYIALPPFWNTYFSNYVPYTKNNPKGFTLSYWINITQSRSSPSGGINLPFTASDTANKIFYGRNNNQDLFGMQKIVDRLGMFRYNDITATRYPWYLWFYDPISFRSSTGWFHVIWTQNNDWLTIHFFKPDGSYFCQSMYMEIQDLHQLTDWGLGNKAPAVVGPQSLILDDFRIYNWPLSPQEARELDSLERPPSLPMAMSCASCKLQREGTKVAAPPPAGDVQVFPNPARNSINIELTLPQAGQVLVKVYGTDGREQLIRAFTLPAGSTRITLDDLNLASGLYFFSIQGGGLNETRKVMIQL